MSMLTATKVAAIATGILALFAIVTAIVAGLTLRKQSTQVELLKEQAKRDTDQRRRAQVSRVFLWNAYGPLMFTASDDDDPDVSLHTSVHLKNTSDQPVYDIMFTWHYDHHTVPGRHVRQLMPGMDLKDDPPRGVADQLPASTRLYADATFRDAASVRWRRGQGGQLDELLPGQWPRFTERSVQLGMPTAGDQGDNRTLVSSSYHPQPPRRCSTLGSGPGQGSA